jgi:hypothetical protein
LRSPIDDYVVSFNRGIPAENFDQEVLQGNISEMDDDTGESANTHLLAILT